MKADYYYGLSVDEFLEKVDVPIYKARKERLVERFRERTRKRFKTVREICATNPSSIHNDAGHGDRWKLRTMLKSVGLSFGYVPKGDRHISLYVSSRSSFTRIVNGLRFVYFPTTIYYVRRLCYPEDDYWVVRDLKTIELRGRTGKMTFDVEDIFFKEYNGRNCFKIYLGEERKEL